MVPRSMCKDENDYLEMLRNDFAAKAMAGEIAGVGMGSLSYRLLAQSAYEIADIMLEVREK